jgi:hypothetical protein
MHDKLKPLISMSPQWTPGEDLFGVAFAAKIYSAISQDKTTATVVTVLLPHSSWTAAIQSSHRNARRNQSHQRTQGNVLWQRGGRGRLRG